MSKVTKRNKTAMQTWIKQHKFELALLAFGLIVLPSMALYLAAQNGATGWIWALLGLVVAGNLVSLFIK
jgi:hypothetical protein